ncbi:MAG: hypothetical protein Q8P05_00580 [Candidatus Diapherotrites archaeon]|nr:hypothetical protein [Candidatus Diapherotrites archaeon]
MIGKLAIVFLLLFLLGCVNTPNESNDRGNIPSGNSPATTNNSFNPDVPNQPTSNGQPYNAGDTVGNTIENCDNPIFTAYFVDPKYVQKVGQVGVVHGSGLYIVERSYVSVKIEFSGEKIPVYAPVDLTLRSGSHYQNPAASNTALPDYALWFDAGCGVEVNLAHLKEVVDPIAKQLLQVKTDSRSSQLTPITFRAGDIIGHFIHNEGDVAGFDFIVRDKKVINEFINPERYSGNRASNLLNGVCPYDYYESEKKQEYYNLLGGGGGTLFTVKDCGRSSRDVIGTISGMWFLDKEPQENIYDGYKDGDYGSTLSIVGDEERITIGNLGPNPTSWVYPTNPTYTLPEKVIDEHCYQIDGYNPSQNAGWVYIKLISSTEARVSYSPTGTCPDSFPESSKVYYK